MPRSETLALPRFDTPARLKLIVLVEKVGGIGKLATLLGSIDRSQVGRWLAGHSRPKDNQRPLIVHVARRYGVKGEFDWQTPAESRALKQRLSAIAVAAKAGAA